MIGSNNLATMYGRTDRWAAHWSYPWILASVLVAVSIFLAYPCLTCFNAEAWPWQVVMLKAAEPTHGLGDIAPTVWLSKKVFRLTVPLIIRVAHLPPIGVILLQFLLVPLMIVHIQKLLMRILCDGVASTLITAGIMFLYFGRAGFHDLYYLWFDGFTFFFLVMAMFYRWPLLIFIFSTAATWNDERGFMALGIVYMFHQMRMMDHKDLAGMDLFRPNYRGVAVLAAIAGYLLVRFILSHSYDMHTPTEGAEFLYLQRTLPFLPIGAWTFFEGFWLLFLLSVAYAWRYNKFQIFICMLGTVGAGLIISGFVSDITRTGSHLVPLIFIMAGFLGSILQRNVFRVLLLVIFMVTLLFPATIVCPDWQIHDWFQWPWLIEISKGPWEPG